MILAARIVVSGCRVLSPGWIEVAEGRVAAVGDGIAPSAEEALAGVVLPGLTDIHVHGAIGHDFATATAEQARAAADFHARAGTTTLLTSIATAPAAVLERAVDVLAPLAAAGVTGGIHLEGPHLSVARRGAHDPSLLRAPEPAALSRLLDRAAGAIRMVTIAPELPGADDVIALLRDGGVAVALGHSDADVTTAARAADLGASLVTHVFNGMRPLHHRDPGLAGAALTDARLHPELIADGHHIAPAAIDLVRAAARERYLLVSDAMSATGLADGDYRVAGSDVRVESGIARTMSTGSLAGSTSVLADGARRLLADHGADPLEVARATSTRPRALAGLLEASLRVGDPADLVVLADDGNTRTMRSGRWLA